MTMVLRWRNPAPAITLRWRGPGGMLRAIERKPAAPIAAVIGPPGLPGSSEVIGITVTAGEAIGGHRAVTFDAAGEAVLADHRTLAAGAALALSTHAASSGADLTVQASGPIEEPGWSWQPGPIYVGQDGVLTQTPPTSGVLAQIGSALGPSKMIVAAGMAIAI